MKAALCAFVAFLAAACAQPSEAKQELRPEQTLPQLLPAAGGARSPDRTLCHRSGCFGEVCVRAEDSVFTDCTWRAEFASTRLLDCEPQPDGRCGFSGR